MISFNGMDELILQGFLMLDGAVIYFQSNSFSVE